MLPVVTGMSYRVVFEIEVRSSFLTNNPTTSSHRSNCFTFQNIDISYFFFFLHVHHFGV